MINNSPLLKSGRIFIMPVISHIPQNHFQKKNCQFIGINNQLDFFYDFSVTNYFVVNLSIADLLVTIICMPMAVSQAVSIIWVYGEIMCKLFFYLQGKKILTTVHLCFYFCMYILLLLLFIVEKTSYFFDACRSVIVYNTKKSK